MYPTVVILMFACSFFDEVLRIGQPDFVPTETDALRARKKSAGIAETRFNMGQVSSIHTCLYVYVMEREKCLVVSLFRDAVTNIICPTAIHTHVRRWRTTFGTEEMDPLL